MIALRPILLFLLLRVEAIPTLAGQTTPPSTPPSSQKPADAHPNPDEKGLYHLDKGFAMPKGFIIPKLVYSVEPEFSEKARKAKISADITVRMMVGADGRVDHVRVVKSAGDRYKDKKKSYEAAITLDEKAMEAARQYRFEPGTFQGKPVPVEMDVEVNFMLF
jgi:hypothetical protein